MVWVSIFIRRVGLCDHDFSESDIFSDSPCVGWLRVGGGTFGLSLTEIGEIGLVPEDGCLNAASINLNANVTDDGSQVSRDRRSPSCGNGYGTWYQLVDATEDVVVAATCHPNTLTDASISVCKYTLFQCKEISEVVPSHR